MNSQTIPLLLQVWMAGENHSQGGLIQADIYFWVEVVLTTYSEMIVRERFS